MISIIPRCGAVSCMLEEDMLQDWRMEYNDKHVFTYLAPLTRRADVDGMMMPHQSIIGDLNILSNRPRWTLYCEIRRGIVAKERCFWSLSIRSQCYVDPNWLETPFGSKLPNVEKIIEWCPTENMVSSVLKISNHRVKL